MHTHFLAWLKDRNRGYCLLLIGAVLALYLPYLANPFFFDDIAFFSSVRYPYGVYSDLLKPRATPYNSLLLTLQWFGSDLPHAYRLVDAVLHAATAIALFVFLRSLLRHTCDQRTQQGTLDFAAAAAALLFALHPVASYAAGYIIQRSIVMATLFALLSQWAYLNALVTGKRRWLVLTVLAYFFACFSKEHAVSVALLIAAITVLMRARLRAVLPATLPALLLPLLVTALSMGVVAVLVALRVRGVVGTTYEPMAAHAFAQSGVPDVQLSHPLSIVTQAGLYFKYLMLWLMPNPAWMSVDMRSVFLNSLTQWQAWAGALAFLLYGGVAMRMLFARGTVALAGFGLLSPWLMFLVEFSAVRVQEAFVLYRSYLWMSGLMLLAALLMVRLQQVLAKRGWSRPWVRLGVLLVLLAVLVPATRNRLDVASDTWRLWDDAARMLDGDAVPGADRILYNRANAALVAGRPADAISDLNRVARLRPELFQVQQALGYAHFANNDFSKAETAFRQGLTQQPGNAVLLYARAIALARLGQMRESREDMAAACAAQHMLACLASASMQVKGKQPGVRQRE
ncbi:tetratricopeptide repeat protein [Lacisediminimonas sp.]|uniref:tetratricopeptide repeat protein n=1 Tax=Lacisediminimonas sp. TaxID=3060582 RepID=UPI00271CB80E|nr:tetratricopeptide repeat protein [Lacisediminimonas sp.]MDO8300035.1 tetratricopeptide repeat protein [Lacisediminimonas sp.]